MGMAHNTGLQQLGTAYTGLANNAWAQANPYGGQGGGAAMSAYAQQALAAGAYAAQQRQAYMPKDWVINGKAYSINEFANEIFGDDTPEKTMFLLRYAEQSKK